MIGSRVTFPKKTKTTTNKTKTKNPQAGTNHNHAGIKICISAPCIHVLLPQNLDKGVWRDLIIVHKGTLLRAGINYRDS